MNQNKVYAMIGMAMRARCVVSGEVACESAVKSMKAHLVIVPTDASFNTKKLFSNKTTFYEIPYVEFGTKDELGHAIGKDMRSSVAITNEGFAKAIISKMEKIQKDSTEED